RKERLATIDPIALPRALRRRAACLRARCLRTMATVAAPATRLLAATTAAWAGRAATSAVLRPGRWPGTGSASVSAVMRRASVNAATAVSSRNDRRCRFLGMPDKGMSRAEELRASPPLFSSPVLDAVTRVHWTVVPLIFVPAIAIFLYE